MENFKKVVSRVENLINYKQALAFGIARVESYQNQSLQACFPVINYKKIMVVMLYLFMH